MVINDLRANGLTIITKLVNAHNVCVIK